MPTNAASGNHTGKMTISQIVISCASMRCAANCNNFRTTHKILSIPIIPLSHRTVTAITIFPFDIPRQAGVPSETVGIRGAARRPPHSRTDARRALHLESIARQDQAIRYADLGPTHGLSYPPAGLYAGLKRPISAVGISGATPIAHIEQIQTGSRIETHIRGRVFRFGRRRLGGAAARVASKERRRVCVLSRHAMRMLESWGVSQPCYGPRCDHGHLSRDVVDGLVREGILRYIGTGRMVAGYTYGRTWKGVQSGSNREKVMQLV